MLFCAFKVFFQWTLMLTVYFWSTNGLENNCPQRTLIKPCSCQEKHKGYDILCEGANVNQLRKPLKSIGQTNHSVVYFKLRRIFLPTLPAYFFKDLIIIHLIAHHCNISSIEKTVFDGLSDKLESIDLSENSLTQVPTDSLKMLSSLVSLSLNYNNIQVLHKKAFRGLTSLVRLSIYGNKITLIDSAVFDGIGRNLTRINLGGNQLHLFNSKSFINLTFLKRLQIHENNIIEIGKSTFESISKGHSLDALNLASNFLKEIPNKTFQTLNSLNSLALERNRISYIHSDAFYGIEDSLEWLTLSENLLQEVPSHALKKLTKLRQLDLRSNNITIIKESSLKEFGINLKFLDLKNNKITHIEIGAFDKLILLEWLYLDSNQLKILSYETFFPILDSLKVLDIHNNPFYCDCSLIWLGDWLAEEGKNVITFPEKTLCVQSKSLKQIPIFNFRSKNSNCVNKFINQSINHLINRSAYLTHCIRLIIFCQLFKKYLSNANI